MPRELSKQYDASKIEGKWYHHWLEQGYFHSKPNPERTPYVIVIPPPNITGILTLGHVLNNTMQDILIRFHRMRGFETCWIPGTDHASIATETKVIRMLAEKGLTKSQLGREKFLEHAWAWKEKYGGIIIEQLKALGTSCDWERTRFTMDPDYTRAVLTAFVKLYHKGYIYRGKRLVNWCPATRSAISDEEVIYREVKSHLWYLRYPLENSNDYVVVATTRPETMLGDTAVAVHPEDSRYRHLIGKQVRLPLVGRLIPIIADALVDPEFGTGAVKVTPAHDPNDWELAQRHQLEIINILNPDASLNENVPEEFRGLDRFEAREKVVEHLEAQGLLEKIEDYVHNVGYSERGGVPIEPYLSEQWFLRMAELAKPALEVVRRGEVKFYPAHWVKTYEHWMTNIRDWCISRQLWWGHRIPVYTCQDCGELIVQVDPPDKCVHCGGTNLEQDPDVLDTWASSWLWPFAVHSWPDDSPELRYYYPTNDLVTGPDIIFFWVARMIMAGLEFMGEVPFKRVYFTSILRDAKGRKMSKSLGNSPDPLDLIDRYGADALRYGIMLIAPQGQDILFSEERLEVARNFMNKIWNAARFVLMNLEEPLDQEDLQVPNRDDLELVDRWILHQLNKTIQRVTELIDRFKFNEAARSIWDFAWGDYCDWFLECVKIRLYGDDLHARQIGRRMAVIVLRTLVKLLHPLAPFITEELWQQVKLPDEPDLIVASWPQPDASWENSAASAEMRHVQNIITAVRNIRAELNVPPGKTVEVYLKGEKDNLPPELPAYLERLARVSKFESRPQVDKPRYAATAVVDGWELFVPLEDLIDLEQERARLTKERERLENLLQRTEAKLQNTNFVERAPAEVVERERQKARDYRSALEKLNNHLQMLGGE